MPVSRRSLTLLLSSALAAVLTVTAFVVQVPYVLLSGGPVFNTIGQTAGKDVITISGRQTFPADGQLDLTTVSVDRSISLAEALKGWFSRDEAVAPTALLYPPDQTPREAQQEAQQEMVQSQSSAKSAALLQLGIPVTVTVQSVPGDSPSTGRLRPGDVLTAVGGKPVTSPDVLRDLIGARSPGQPVTLTYDRDGTEGTATITTGSTEATADSPARAIIGITTAITDYPFDITISLEDVGGPSAGLMFSLGIIDKLTPGNLSGGRHVAGTGTMDADGNVGPIGGIQQKMAAAGKLGVDVFLVPADNCKAAQENKPKGLQLIRVTTLKSALDGLQALNGGRTPQGCAS